MKNTRENDKKWIQTLQERNRVLEEVLALTQLENKELTEQLRIGGVSKSFNSEEELLQFIYMHTPIAIKPKSKQAKGQLVSAFKSGNAFDQVCRHLAKKLFNVC